MIKRWHSYGRITRSSPGASSPAAAAGASSGSQDCEWWLHSASFHGDEVPPGLHLVYVGKLHRTYLVSDDLVGHPLFRVLVERCSDDADAETVVVGCEVVLFEHLLWMLENAESLDELVELYAC